LWLLRPPGRPMRAPAAVPGLALLATGAAVALAWLPAGTPWWRALDWGGPAALLVASLLALEQREAVRWPRALLRLGDASYAIYLVHGFVLGALAAVPRVPSAWVLLAAALALSTAAGLAVHHGVERPIAAWFARRRAGGTPHGLGSRQGAEPGSVRARKGSGDPLIPLLK